MDEAMTGERDLIWEQDLTFVEQSRLAALSQSLPTPFYLYDEAGISRTLAEISAGFQWCANHTTWVAVRRTACDPVLQLLYTQGCGLICVDLAELERVERLGLSGEKILYAPLLPDQKGLEKIVQLSGTLAIDNCMVSQIALEKGLIPPHIQFRYNPGNRIFYRGRVVSKPGRTYLGMPKQELLQTAKTWKNAPISTVTLGGEMDAYITDLNYYGVIARELWTIKSEIEGALGREISGFYLGDAMGEGERVNPLSLGDKTQKIIEEGEISTDFPLGMGLSRLVLAPHGILIAKILGIKELERKVLILDVTRDALGLNQGQDVYVSLVGDASTIGRQFYSIIGYSHDSKDRISAKRMLPKGETGQCCSLFHLGYRSGANDYGNYLYRADDSIAKD